MSSTSDAGKTNSEPEPELKTDAQTQETKVVNSIRRWSMGTTMSIQILAVAVLLIALNIVVYYYGQQHDLTRQGNIQLSKPTIENLNSSTLQDRERSVKIIAVINPNQFATFKNDSQEDVRERLKMKLQEYADKSKGKIELEFVNAIVDHGRLQELTTQYQFKFNTSAILIDARPEITPNEEMLRKLKEINPKMSEKALIAGYETEILSRHVRIVPAKELYYSDVDINYDSRHFISAWKDEAEITTNLVRAIEGKPKKVYFLYDKCRLDSKLGGKAPWEYVERIFKSQNIQLQELSLANLPVSTVNGKKIKRIPLDADAVALISPDTDFTDQELQTLQEYWEARDSSSILITTDPEKNLPKLYSYLLRAGVRPNKDRIIRKEGDQILVNAEVEFLQGPQVNGDLSGKSTTFGGASQSIEIRQPNNNTFVEAFPLIKAGPAWWGETSFGASNTFYDKKSDTPKPLYLGAAVTRGKLNDQMTSQLVSKLVIIGNSDFLSREKMRDEQSEFISQTGAWLVGREPLMNVPGHPNYRRKVFIAAAHRSLIENIFIVFFPAAALIITGFVWNIRRS